jgi:hypothetical protein
VLLLHERLVMLISISVSAAFALLVLCLILCGAVH